MPTVTFYIIRESQPADRHYFACRLVEKIHGRQRRIYIHTGDSAQADEIDDLLWSYRPESFLPHMIAGSEIEDDEEVPIIIGYEDTCSGPRDVLINLSDTIPPFHGEFERIAEIVRADEDAKALSREHWKFYRDQGYDVEKYET